MLAIEKLNTTSNIGSSNVLSRFSFLGIGSVVTFLDVVETYDLMACASAGNFVSNPGSRWAHHG